MEPIAIQNEWSRLEEVILGIAPELYFPGIHPLFLEPVNPRWQRAFLTAMYSLGQGRRVPTWLTKKYIDELQALRQVLLDHDVVVHHPIPIEPLPGEPAGLGQMFPRDPIMAIGNIMIDGNMRMDLRHKERRGLDVLLEKLAHGGAQITPVPSKEMYLEGGDVIIDLPYVYVGVGKYASNLDGATWLQTQLGKAAKVVPVPLEITGIQHLDCCMTLIGPRSGIIHLDALSQPLPPPLNSYEFITVDAQTRQELGTNVLVLDPETIIVQARHTRLRRQLEKKHFNVIPLKFGWHALIGGAFRCATAPIRRSA